MWKSLLMFNGTLQNWNQPCAKHTFIDLSERIPLAQGVIRGMPVVLGTAIWWINIKNLHFMLWDVKPLYLISLTLKYGQQVLKYFVKWHRFSFCPYKSVCISYVRMKAGMTQSGICYARYFKLNNQQRLVTDRNFSFGIFKAVCLINSTLKCWTINNIFLWPQQPLCPMKIGNIRPKWKICLSKGNKQTRKNCKKEFKSVTPSVYSSYELLLNVTWQNPGSQRKMKRAQRLLWNLEKGTCNTCTRFILNKEIRAHIGVSRLIIEAGAVRILWANCENIALLKQMCCSESTNSQCNRYI